MVRDECGGACDAYNVTDILDRDHDHQENTYRNSVEVELLKLKGNKDDKFNGKTVSICYRTIYCRGPSRRSHQSHEPRQLQRRQSPYSRRRSIRSIISIVKRLSQCKSRKMYAWHAPFKRRFVSKTDLGVYILVLWSLFIRNLEYKLNYAYLWRIHCLQYRGTIRSMAPSGADGDHCNRYTMLKHQTNIAR